MILYILAQCTWGFLQSTAGFITFLINIREKHFIYHGAVVTEWKLRSSVSLGMFIFVTKHPGDELKRRITVHEYGHTIQSLILGPMYLLVIGAPSLFWAGIPAFSRMRRRRHMSYYRFYPERWANHLGEKTTRERSPGFMDID